MGPWSSPSEARCDGRSPVVYRFCTPRPRRCCVLVLYPRYEAFIADRVLHQEPGPATRFIAGAMAGCSAVTCTYPLDLLRTRHAGRVGQGSILAIARETVAKRGVLALWGGAYATLAGGVIFEGARFGTFGSLMTGNVIDMSMAIARVRSLAARSLAAEKHPCSRQFSEPGSPQQC